MDMVAVTGDDVIMTGIGRLQHTKGAGLLTGIEVQEAANVTFHVGLVAALFKATGKQHFAQYAFFISVFHSLGKQQYPNYGKRDMISVLR